MQHALFLDRPVRRNPRRPASELDVSMLPSPPCETVSPAPSVPSRSDSTHDSDVRPTMTIEKSTTEHMAVIASMTRPHRQTVTNVDSLVAPAVADKPPEEPSLTPGPSQQKGRRKLTKAACSSCRQRKSKCDGKRPACTTCRTKTRTCEYMTEEGVSSQAAYKSRLEDYANVLRLLQSADNVECGQILDDLRRPEGLAEGIKDVLDKWVENE